MQTNPASAFLWADVESCRRTHKTRNTEQISASLNKTRSIPFVGFEKHHHAKLPAKPPSQSTETNRSPSTIRVARERGSFGSPPTADVVGRPGDLSVVRPERRRSVGRMGIGRSRELKCLTATPTACAPTPMALGLNRPLSRRGLDEFSLRFGALRQWRDDSWLITSVTGVA